MGIKITSNSVKPNWHKGKEGGGGDKKLRFEPCPHCGKKGYYRIPQLYEYCRYCGINRVTV